MNLKSKQVFTRKGGQTLYKWSPQTSITDKKGKSEKLPQFCNATPQSIDGIDSITKYVTEKEFVNGVIKYKAYVACDYVK